MHLTIIKKIIGIGWVQVHTDGDADFCQWRCRLIGASLFMGMVELTQGATKEQHIDNFTKKAGW